MTLPGSGALMGEPPATRRALIVVMASASIAL